MKPSVRYGLILGTILAAVPLLLYALGVEKEDAVQKVSGFVNVAIISVLIFLGIKATRQLNNGFISFGNGFSSGMMIAFIGAAMSGVFSYLYFTVINPGMITYIKMKQEQAMIEKGMSDADIEKISGSMEFFSSPAMMSGFAFLGYMILGLVVALICAGILKKEDPSELIS